MTALDELRAERRRTAAADGLEFLRADAAHAAWRSPLAYALADAPAEISDVSAEAHAGPLGLPGGIAGIEIDAPTARTLIARLTDLEPPAVGSIACVRAQVTQEGDHRYRIWVAREYCEYLAEVVLDAWEGLA
jgi:sarcosine oxidase gamma subunit